MLFNSIDFLIFFPVVTLIFFIIPKKFKKLWLLIASYYFYMSWDPIYAILIAASTLVTFIVGIIIGKINEATDTDDLTKTKHKKTALVSGLVFNLLILFIFKYSNFLFENLTAVFTAIGLNIKAPVLDLLLPVGISFYTFQALGYSIDVYRGTVKPEKNLVNYALFVSFFPQLVAGPIERSSNLLGQIEKIADNAKISFENVRTGLLLMFWGLFEKLVIADRAAILVNTVYNNYTEYGLVSIVFATIMFAFQVYCDFDGYTNIARGAAKVLNITLMKNFKQPYLATGIKDFWRRWHISLTSWFTDYLYIPLGGNRKGLARQLVNTLIVFSVSGLWHGASWNYVVWGVLHAVFQCTEIIMAKFNKPSDTTLTLSKRLEKIFITFALTTFAWIFFRCESLGQALAIIRQMLTQTGFASLMNMGLNSVNMIILIFALILLLLVDILHECNVSVFKFVYAQQVWFRFALYLFLIWSCIMLGIYGVSYTSSQFIYFQF